MYVVTNPPSDSSSNPLPPSGPPVRQYEPTSGQDVIDLILRDPEYVEFCVQFLFHKQENDEQARQKTIHRNGVGFDAADASIFTPIAERLLSGHSLSSDELAACRKPTKNGKPRIAKYWRQLLNVANGGGVQ
jgi:hypothetical protein